MKKEGWRIITICVLICMALIAIILFNMFVQTITFIGDIIGFFILFIIAFITYVLAKTFVTVGTGVVSKVDIDKNKVFIFIGMLLIVGAFYHGFVYKDKEGYSYSQGKDMCKSEVYQLFAHREDFDAFCYRVNVYYPLDIVLMIIGFIVSVYGIYKVAKQKKGYQII